MGQVRRSGRISKKIPVLLLGTDTSGRIFSELTSTLVLSRHGVGLLSYTKVAPDEMLTLRLIESHAETAVRLVGQMGKQGDAFVYGMAFADPDIDFWQIEFPPVDQPKKTAEAEQATFECRICGDREVVEQSDIEADVYLVNESILRYCESCGISTNWQRPEPGAQSRKSIEAARPSPPASTGFGSMDKTPAHTEPPLEAEMFESFQPSPEAPDSVSTAYGAESPSELELGPSQHLSVSASTAVLEVEPPAARAALTAAPPNSRGKNRRRDVRTSITFMACVRMPASDADDDVVECDNVSRGGVSFRSRRTYTEGMTIEIAAPYSPGSPAIFARGTIRRAEALPGVRSFRYGVEYVRVAKPNRH